MKATDRRQLIGVIVVAIIVVAATWYAMSRQKYYAGTLTSITYVPAASGSRGPYLTFTFAADLPRQLVAGTSAVFKSFRADSRQSASADVSSMLIAALTAGAPFVPDPQSDPAVVTTNTLPAGVPAVPVTLTGRGTMWFMVPY